MCRPTCPPEYTRSFTVGCAGSRTVSGSPHASAPVARRSTAPARCAGSLRTGPGPARWTTTAPSTVQPLAVAGHRARTGVMGRTVRMHGVRSRLLRHPRRHGPGRPRCAWWRRRDRSPSSSPSTRTSRRPVRRRTRAGVSCPASTWHTHDLFVTLTAAAAATSRLRVGSGICLVVQRDPIITAKQVASVDLLSGGRLEFGVGAGWNREEMAEPRHRPAAADGGAARARRGDEADLDPGRGDLPRRARQLRPDLVVAQARPAPAPAGARRRSAGRRCSTGCSPSATRGSRTTPRPSLSGRASCARGPTATSTSW